jgi:crossover junction endodeoxyribonuclease RuvC
MSPTQRMKIVALDLSLTETGWARSGGEYGTITGCDLTGMDRIDRILATIGRTVGDADLVVLEGYSFASRGRAILSIAELGGVVRWTMRYNWGLPYVEVPPASRAKYATGKGNASKDLVLVEAVKRLGYSGSNHNEADALWLLHMALDHYGLLGKVKVPEKHREALAGVTWEPKIEVIGDDAT